MDTKTARTLNAMNKRFYETHATSFSATRSQGWRGWERLAETVCPVSSVFDLGCGNMRFKVFLELTQGGNQFSYYGVDVCDGLVRAPRGVHYQHLDVVDAVLDGSDLAMCVEAPACELSVAFGFMHHVPGIEARMRIMDLIVGKTAAGGKACVSFWHFMDDERLSAKARDVTADVLAGKDLALEGGDYFLDWQGSAEVPRYCHSFSEDEIDALAQRASRSCTVIERYRADGKSGSLNSYLVLGRC